MYTINYILTSNGYFNINELINEKLKVYGICKWSNINLTLKMSPNTTIEFSNGAIISVPSDHKLYNEEMNLVSIADLNKNTKIFQYNMPQLKLKDKKNDNNYTNGYFLGWLNGIENKDIQIVNDLIYIYLNDDKKIISSKLKIIGKYVKKENLYIAILKITNKDVPINTSIENKIEWLAGLFDSIGYTYHKKYEARYIKMKLNNREFGNKVVLLSNLLGLSPNLEEIIINRKNKETGIKTNKYYELIFKSDDITTLLEKYKLNFFILDYNKNEVNMEPIKDPIIYIKNIIKHEEEYSFDINQNIDYIVNGIVIHS